VWSPDGTKILLSIQGSLSNHGAPELRLFDVRTGQSKHVSDRPIDMLIGPAWLPDNRRILVAWPEEARGADLWLLDTETGTRTLVLPGADAGPPTLSIDGTVAYMTNLSNLDLLELPLDGSAPRPLLATKQSESSVSWSPVAPEFAYVAERQI